MLYYVAHPDFEFSATIEAPSTDKARTAFLDYLERLGKVSRRFRQSMRRGIATKRLVDASDVTTDVSLDYEYGNIEKSSAGQPFRTELIEKSGTNLEEVSIEPPVQQEQVQQPAQRQMMPIAAAALRSFGVR